MPGKKRTNDEFVEELNEKRPNIIPLEPFSGVDNKIKCRCKTCGDEFYAKPYVLLSGKSGNGCRKCAGTKKKTHEEYVQELIDKNIPVEVLETYKGNPFNILHRCKKCGYTWSARPSNILNGNLCPVCAGKVAMKGYNDLWTTHPHIAEWLENPLNGHHFTYGSGKKVNWKCPHCGNIISRIVRDVVRQNNLPCHKCSDGVSYPMKFTISVFDQLNIPIETEKRFKWCIFNLSDGKSHYGIYDIVFSYNSNQYIVEVDGGFHRNYNYKSNRPLEELQAIDNAKDELAAQNGYHMIRIPVYDSTIDSLRDSILKSELSDMFDLSSIDWIQCHRVAVSSRIVKAAELWNKYHSAHAIADEMKIRQECVTKYLRKATKAGLCHYDGKEEQRKSGHRQGLINAKNNFSHLKKCS